MLGQLAAEVSLEYDQEGDVLYLSLGAPRAAWSSPSPKLPGLLIRRAFDNGEVCGATVIGFSELDQAELDAVLPFRVDWRKLRR